MDIKDRVRGTVTFSHYQSGDLWYRCEDGFTFPVPVPGDTGAARFLPTDKGIYFMRYIRKHMAEIAKEAAPV